VGAPRKNDEQKVPTTLLFPQNLDAPHAFSPPQKLGAPGRSSVLGGSPARPFRHLFGDFTQHAIRENLLSEAGAAEEAESPAVVPRLLLLPATMRPSGHYPSKPIRALDGPRSGTMENATCRDF